MRRRPLVNGNVQPTQVRIETIHLLLAQIAESNHLAAVPLSGRWPPVASPSPVPLLLRKEIRHPQSNPIASIEAIDELNRVESVLSELYNQLVPIDGGSLSAEQQR